MIPLLCPAYLPNINYFNWLLKQELVYFSGETYYQKQTYRNRTLLYGANGILRLTIPIKHHHNGIKPKDKEVLIAYDMNWQKQHWKSLCSAYRSSPYFEFYETDLYPFFKEKKPSLFEYNLQLIEKLMELMDIPLNFKRTETLTEKHQPMEVLLLAKETTPYNPEPYTQVFSDKFGFLPNLSILDALFNLGPNCANYILKTKS